MRRHDTDAVSLTFGSVFVAIVAAWLLSRWLTVDLPAAGWFVAGTLILVGAIGVTVAARQGRGVSGGGSTTR